MLLKELQEFIEKKEKVSFEEICCRFSHEPTAIKEMLGLLEKKNIIEKEIKTGICHGCDKGCVSTEPIIYLWKKN